MSDVEKHIEQWRAGLAGSEALRDTDIEELEGHLREEMDRLKPLGLSEAESFLVARHRLGTAAALEAEYEKVNTDRRALLRLSWMAAGVLVYVLAGYIAMGVSHSGMVAAILLRVGVTSIALVGVATKVAAAAVLFLLVWVCVRRASWGRLAGRLRSMSRPWLILLLGGLVVANCLLLGFELLFRAAAVRCLNTEEYARMTLVWTLANLGWAILAPILAASLIPALQAYARRCETCVAGPSGG